MRRRGGWEGYVWDGRRVQVKFVRRGMRTGDENGGGFEKVVVVVVSVFRW